MKELESYLIRLGFSIDDVSRAKFTGEIEKVGKKVHGLVGNPTSGLVGDLLKLQFAFTGVFASLGAAFLGFVEKMGATNQEMRLGAMHALVSQEAYTKMNVALKALGVTLDDLWDPKTRHEFEQLVADQDKMYAGAHQYSDEMENVRFQLIRTQEIAKGFADTVGQKVFAALGFGNGALSEQLNKLNNLILEKMPQWSDVISNDLVPVLKDVWEVAKDTGDVFKTAFEIFQNVVGILSGDTSLQGTAVTMKSVADTTEHVVHWVDELVKSILHLEQALLHVDFSKLTGGDLAHLGEAALLTKTGRGLLWGAGKKVLTAGGGVEAAEGAGLAGAASIGLPVAAGVGAGYELYQHRTGIESWGHSVVDGLPSIPDLFGGKGADIHDRLKAAADRISALTGQDPSLIFGQLAHETGAFTKAGPNRGFRSLHNLSGIEDGHGEYRSFDSDESYDEAMARILNRDFKGMFASTPEEYASALKKGHYYEASQTEYARGISQFAPQYAGAGDTHITVNVAQTNASPADITRAVQDGISQSNKQRDFSMTAQAAGVGQ